MSCMGGGHFKCSHPGALHCVNPGLGITNEQFSMYMMQLFRFVSSLWKVYFFFVTPLYYSCKFEVILFSYNRANGSVLKYGTGCHVTITD